MKQNKVSQKNKVADYYMWINQMIEKQIKIGKRKERK